MGEADLLFRGGPVYTMDPRRPRATWVAVRGERIAAVGSGAGFERWAGPRTRHIELTGRALVPGLQDAHCHLLATLAQRESIDCGPERAPSLHQLVAILREEGGEVPPGAWVRAAGYHEALLAERRHPTRWDLDAALPDRAVVLHHQSRHAVVLNSLALRRAGVARETPDPPGGWWERDASGEPTGVGYHVTTWLSERGIPPPLSEAELERLLVQASAELCSLGITTIHDATATNDLERWADFQRWTSQGLFTPRVRMLVGATKAREFREHGLAYRAGTPQLRVGPAKVVLDETPEGFAPPVEEFAEQVRKAVEAGFPVAIHAVEEPALVITGHVLRELLAERPLPFRPRIEHATVLPPWLVSLLRPLRPLIVTHPHFLYWHGDRYRQEVPEHQRRWLYRGGALRAAGFGAAYGSDSPVAPWSPWPALYAAVTRRTRGGTVLGPGERLTVLRALAGFTRYAALAAGDAAELGSIRPGKLADLVVLDADPVRVEEAEQLLHIRPAMTVVGGKVVWEAADPTSGRAT